MAYTNTEMFCYHIRSYRKAMIEAKKARESALAEIAVYKGSDGFETKEKEIAKAYAEKKSALSREYGELLHKDMERMAAAYDARPAQLVSPEQLSLLQSLDGREKVTKDEWRQAANTLKDNASALAHLKDILQKRGIQSVAAEIGMVAPSNPSESIKSLKNNVRKLLQLEELGRPGADYIKERNLRAFSLDREFSSDAETLSRFGVDDPETFSHNVN